jgi:hypothetical protein
MLATSILKNTSWKHCWLLLTSEGIRLLTKHPEGAKSVGFLKWLVNEQYLATVVGKMPAKE